ncbi:hypothetical protein IE077_002308, partial [Cardiosporidium cionae]
FRRFTSFSILHGYTYQRGNNHEQSRRQFSLQKLTDTRFFSPSKPEDRPTVYLKADSQLKFDTKPAERLANYHPWIYDTEIQEISSFSTFPAGTLVNVVHSTGEGIGVGILNRNASVVIRLLTNILSTVITEEFFRERIRKALLRRQNYTPGNLFYRAVYAENDNFPGLIVDRWGKELLVIRYDTQGVQSIHTLIEDELRKLLRPKSLCVHSITSRKEKHAHSHLYDSVLHRGKDETVKIKLGNVTMALNVLADTFEGCPFDEEEIAFLSSLCKGDSVLDIFSSFTSPGLHCAFSGASEVLLLEHRLSQYRRMEQTLELNSLQSCCTVLHREDIENELKKMAQSKLKFGMILLNFGPNLRRSYKVMHSQFGKWYRPSLSGLTHYVRMAAELCHPGGFLWLSLTLPVDHTENYVDHINHGLHSACRSGAFIWYGGSRRDKGVLASSGNWWYTRTLILRLN